jgi:hypothetical protein
MRRLTLVVMLSAAFFGGCGSGAVPPTGVPPSDRGLPGVATSPAGVRVVAADGLLPTLIERGREWRGNPLALGILTSVLLLVALALGAYTLVLVRHEQRAGRP